jgi:hypothetical protein
MNELNELRREEIPQEVLDDISKHVSTVIWDNYGKDFPKMDDKTRENLNAHADALRLDVKTRVSNYQVSVIKEDTDMKGFRLMERYYIRGVFDEHADSLDIYAVWSMPVFVSTKENEICPKFRN